jgi:hypothetical protein
MKKTAKKKLPVKKVAQKRTTAKPRGRKKTAAKRVVAPKKQIRKRNQTTSRPFSREPRGADVGGQSGDLQGLSNVERADSESVDELLEEGNAFEADVVEGVERAGDADESEVQTHEVPADDVPDEYLDKE